MYMMMGEKEDFVPLNWDALVKNPAVFETIKEEMEKKFTQKLPHLILQFHQSYLSKTGSCISYTFHLFRFQLHSKYYQNNQSNRDKYFQTYSNSYLP